MASPLLPFLFCFMILSPFVTFSVVAQTKTNIAIGDSHTAGTSTSPWLVSSPSGDFAFGFLPLEATPDHFILCIWYAKTQNKTIVWFASRDKPAPKGSKVEITADDGLLLTAPNGDQLWKIGGLSARVSAGVLNDTGNFVLQDKSSNSIWESFKDYRDTLLPSQTLEKGQKLSSKLKENDFNTGRFELFFKNDGNLVMHSINLPSGYANENYFQSRTTDSNTSSVGKQLVFDRSGGLYILRENNEKYNLPEGGSGVSISTNQSYLRATLNFDGVFTIYQHPKGSSSGSGGWTPLWSKPDNFCKDYVANDGSGVCGYNSICSLGDDKRPICRCPKWYSLVDPNDPNGSCKPDFVQGCAVDELTKRKDLYDFEVLTDTDWPLSDYVLQKPFTEEKCRQSCMEDCMCSVAVFRLGDSCWKKKLPLSNGRIDLTLNGAKTFMKVRKDNSSLDVPPIIVNRNNRNTMIVVASVLLGGSVCANLILLGAICFSTSYVFRYKKKLRSVTKSETTVETNLRCFTYEELQEATTGFDKVLGKGAFGIVYEGVINMGSLTSVAVKRLNTFLLEDVQKEFKNELNVIGLTHHKNLVRLLGFCETEEEKLLVYEYMSNGTLASLLFHVGKEKPSWKLRIQIANGVARGLLYLHEECSTQIIHCDIKPQNILLDDYYNARISDFGLAKLLNMNQSRTNTAIRGTKGYVALEWFKNMPITAKVDVYSYGVLLLEIVSCRKSVEFEADEDKAILTEWAHDCYTEGALHDLVENDQEALDDKRTLEKLVMIALWCVQEDPGLRPTMKNVTQMLEGVVDVQVPPCPSQISVQYSLN